MPPEEPKETISPEKPGSATLNQFLDKAWDGVNDNEKLTIKEKSDLKKVKQALDEKYDLDKETITRKTETEFSSLIEDTKDLISIRTIDQKLTETDVEDISKFLESILDSRPISVPGSTTDGQPDQNSQEAIARRGSVKSEFDKIAKDKKIEGVESVADLSDLPVETLMKLESEYEGILLYAFTDFVDGSTKIDLKYFESFYKKPVAGTKFKVNFRGNADAENQLGMADLCPPSIRRITVYENGNPELSRTSAKRIGLKGQNKRGSGFFDEEGYIAVYSSDVVIVGGIQKSNTDSGIDMDFEQKYRDKSGKLDFKKYEADFGEEETKLVRTMESRGVRVGKVYTSEELQTLEGKIEASGVRKNIISAAMALLRDGTKGQHCWNWVDKVYKRAGAERGTVAYKHPKYRRGSFDRKNPGKCENPPQAKTLQPGDWIFVWNKNKYDTYGDHSVLFLDWVDKENMIIRVANCTGSGKPGTLRTMDLKKTPLTMLIKPKA